MRLKVLAIDGGTYQCGYAIYEGKRLVKADTIIPPEKGYSFERIGEIFHTISLLCDLHRPDVLVWESWRGPRNPELQTLLRCFTRLAKEKGMEAAEFHASTVVRQLSLNGKGRRKRDARKAAIKEGVLRHYPQCRDLEQDAIDAVAIGRCLLLERGIVS